MRLIRTATVAVALACSCVAAPLAHAQPAPPAPAPAADGPKTTIDADGSYAVGKDIVPGVYQSAGPVDGGACYWKRSAGDKLVDNALTKKPAFVQIDATDTSFTTSDCQAWQLTNGPMPPQPGPGDLLGALTQAIGSGMFNGGPR
ncbi:hypothetical protein EUA04_00660 [Mycolicibacterium obuense]|uniref:Lipoprotein n=1 Tax=Mycolicibacterium obuense TaxID=1807 RepID=A0A4R5XAF6_9MYCO|nr:hypothetical protein [Mycolicibacterium obuense]TDL11562.1 hypothetical protein EUA04_00660 [Mycolicibacterium obuense]